MVERRLTWLAGIVLLWGAAIFLKIISIQVVHHSLYARLARINQEVVVDIPAPRGTIFDRTGQPLAMSVPAESVYVNPLQVPDLEVAAGILSAALHIDETELYGRLKAARESHHGFLWVKRRITAEEAQSLRDLNFDYIAIQSESQRHYPGGAVAAHVLGGVDFEEKGNAGIEKALDADLRGQPGRARMETDAKRRSIDQLLSTEPRPGTSITLTIDERTQFVAEQAIAEAVETANAVSGSVVVMDPRDGAILALASYPPYDPNQAPTHPQDWAARLDHAVSVPFEPGSVFKIMTLSAALETTPLRPESPINCHGGVLRLPGRVVHDSHGGIGIIPMATVLAKSSNIGAIEIGMRVGEQNMYDYVRRFGFGQRTGIELPAESPGRLRKLQYWGKTSLASISMGQEISVTTVQLAQAVSVIASGGLLVRPHLVLRKGGKIVPPQQPVRVIKPETAITMRQMMEGVVMPGGTGTRARLVGYSTGGKTGTAQIFDFATRHYTHSYNGSFAGFAPVTNPAIVVVVTVNGTHGNAGFGGAISAPVFKAVASEALRVLDVPKDLPDEPPGKIEVAKNADLDDVSIAGLGSDQPNILEDSDDGQGGADGRLLSSAARQATNNDRLPHVPNFRGMTMRAVLAEAAAKGLTVLPDGSGTARVQYPAAGSVLHEGERIRVQFAR